MYLKIISPYILVKETNKLYKYSLCYLKICYHDSEGDSVLDLSDN